MGDGGLVIYLISQETQLGMHIEQYEGMKSRILKTALYSAIGASLGFGYYLAVGCSTGSCPITSNPWISGGYGAVLGLLFSRA